MKKGIIRMKRIIYMFGVLIMIMVASGCNSKNGIKNSIAYGENGTVIYENTGNKINEDSVFELASNGKVVTAYIALKLVDEGLIGLDDKIYPYLDDKYLTEDERLKEITLRQLLNHTAGFSPSYELGIDKKTYSDPGEEFCYSGVGYIYLQNVIENVSGMSLEEAAGQYVLNPLNMNNSTFEKRKTVAGHMNMSSAVLYAFVVYIIVFVVLFLIVFAIGKITKNKYYSLKAGMAVVFVLAGIINTVALLIIPNVSKSLYIFLIYFAISGLILLVGRKNSKLFYLCIPVLTTVILVLGFTIPVSIPVTGDLLPRGANAAYSLKSTSKDMAKFCQKLLDEYAAGNNAVSEMFSDSVAIDETNSWGLGIGIEQKSGRKTYWHSGINPGFQSLLVIDPIENKYAIILTSDDKGLSIAKSAAKDFLGIDGTWDIPRGRINLR